VSETLRLERGPDRTAVLTMNRPEKYNAMNHAMFRELPETLRALDADPDVSVCVLTGAGSCFSAGGDIADFDSLEGIEDYRGQVDLALSAFSAVECCQTTVIAAVDGIAFGGGTELVLACDIVIASERARFAFKEVTLGLMPGYGLMRGPDVIGRPWTRRLALTGDEIDARVAERIGLVQEVVPHANLLEHARDLARRIGRNSPTAVQSGKRMINREIGPPGLAGAIEATALLQATPECRQQVAEFMAERARRRARPDPPSVGR
jgi:enoyl-CoA hydratase